jgi:uncharacterized protein (TIGR02246 family)
MSARQPAGGAENGDHRMTHSNPADSVVGVIQAVYDAWADGDADTFAKLYTEDASVVQPGIYKENNEVIRTTMAAGFAGPLKGSRVIDEPQSVRFLGPDAAVVITEGGVLMAGQTEVPAERQVRSTWALTRRDGQWLVVAYHNSPAN